jgi:heme/copper-type cytochrome/quinol oxidase subunit 2
MWPIVGAAGVGFLAAGVAAIFGRSRRRRLASAGDEDAKRKLARRRTVETVVAPIFVVIGIGILSVKFYADYEKARTPLSPEKALERATRSLTKPN